MRGLFQGGNWVSLGPLIQNNSALMTYHFTEVPGGTEVRGERTDGGGP
jgi:hypothetical protein